MDGLDREGNAISNFTKSFVVAGYRILWGVVVGCLGNEARVISQKLLLTTCSSILIAINCCSRYHDIFIL